MQKRLMTIDKGPLKVKSRFTLKGTNRRAYFTMLEDDTLVIQYRTLIDKSRKNISTQVVRLSEQAAYLTVEGILDMYQTKEVVDDREEAEPT